MTEGPQGNKKNAMHQLIILDDEVTVGQTIARIASAESFHSQITTCSPGFFATLANSSPTCIILDLIMPDHDGIEIINRLASQRGNARSCPGKR